MRILLLLIVSLFVLTGATCVNKGTILHTTLDGGTLRKEYISDTNVFTDGTNYAEVHACGSDGVTHCKDPTISVNPNAGIAKQLFTGVSTMGAAAILRDSFKGDQVTQTGGGGSAFAGANSRSDFRLNRRNKH